LLWLESQPTPVIAVLVFAVCYVCAEGVAEEEAGW
jgi:hypothetical protein